MTKSPSLHRSLGLLDAVGVGMGAIIGGGIFVVSGLAVDLAGSAVLVSVALAGIVATSNALSSAQLAASYPAAGGTYEYGYQVLTPWAGFVAGWMFLVAKLTAAATVALGFGSYLGWMLPDVHPRWVAVIAIALFTGLVRLGIRRTSRVNLVLVTLSVGSLVVFVAWSASGVELTSIDPRGNIDGSTLTAAALIFFAYTGYARIATLGEEVVEPRRTIPRAVVITLIVATTLYLAVAAVLAAAGARGPLGETSAPLLTAVDRLGHPALTPVVLVGAAAAVLGVVLNQILGLSRMVFAMARRGDLPAILAEIDPRTGGPSSATLAVGVAGIAIATSGVWSALAAVSAFTILVYYAIANVAALRLQPAQRLFPAIVPWIGLTGCVVLAGSLTRETLAVGLTVLAVGVVYRYARRWKHSNS